MKKKNMKNHIRMRFSTLLLCCLAIVLCAAPCGWADGSYKLYDGEIYDLDDGEIYDVTEDLDWLEVGAGTTVNLRCASVKLYVYAYPGSVLNIYSGDVEQYILVKPAVATGSSEPEAVVTVYGSGFAVDWDRDGTADPLGPSETEFTPLSINSGGSVLKGTYENGAPINLLFYSGVPINLQPPPSGDLEEITIDIKPGSDDNTINLKSWGVVPVAVLTTSDFNADTIDPTTVKFAGALPLRWTLRWKWKMMNDVDDDGDKDMLFFFRTQDLDLDEKSTEATLTLTGETTDGKVIQGTDEVRIVPRKKYYKPGQYSRNRRARIGPQKKK